jgi:hypothetical protein
LKLQKALKIDVPSVSSYSFESLDRLISIAVARIEADDPMEKLVSFYDSIVNQLVNGADTAEMAPSTFSLEFLTDAALKLKVS